MEKTKEIAEVIARQLGVSSEKILCSNNMYSDFEISDDDEDIISGILSSRFQKKIFFCQTVLEMASLLEGA